MSDWKQTFCDLHAHSHYSVLDAVPDPYEMVEAAAKLGRKSLALTDHGSISGHVALERAVSGFKLQYFDGAVAVKTEDYDIKPIYGLEGYATADIEHQQQRKSHVTILAKDVTGYQNILQLVTRSYDEGFYYRPTIDGAMLAEHRDGLVVLSGCELSTFMRSLKEGDWTKAVENARGLQALFGDDFYIEVQHFPHAIEYTRAAIKLAAELGIKVVLTCDVHYIPEDGWRAQQLIQSIRDRKPVAEVDFCMEHAHPWAPDALYHHLTRLDPSQPWDAIWNNVLEVEAKISHYKLPEAPHVTYPLAIPGKSKVAHIRELCHQRMAGQGMLERPEYCERLERELALIEDKEFADYFLVVADLVNWAKDQGIFVGPARGSAAGSLVAWGLRITEVDPLKHDLLFERFIDVTRNDLPDVDIDFEDERRTEVFDYIRERWGYDKTAYISTFSRFGGRSTLDDVAKSFRIPKQAVDIVKRHLVFRSSGDQRSELTILDALTEPEVQEVFEQYPDLYFATEIQGKVRHLGRHAAGMVVTTEPITKYMATYKTPQTEDRMLAVDHRDAEYLNLMKIDILGLKELSILRLVCDQVGMSLEDMYALPLDDRLTLEHFNSHDFLGIFQYTGIATRSVASQIPFREFDEVVDVNALARPGPLHAGSTEKYTQGKLTGRFQPVLPYPEIEAILAPTQGQIVYQEQVMTILSQIGQLGWDLVNDIRKIISKSKGVELFDSYYPQFREGCLAQGFPEQLAEDTWNAIKYYGKYGFNKSHSVSYGLISYYSMYMKAHYPTEFYYAQLYKSTDRNEDIRFIREAMERGVQFAPLDLRISKGSWTIDEAHRVAPGWSVVPGIGPKIAEELDSKGPFGSMDEMLATVNKRIVNKNVQAKLREHLGMTVGDIYGFEEWDRVVATIPSRMTIEQALTFDGKLPVRIVGYLRKINKKNRVEEWESKGKDTSRLRPDVNHEYVILILEDETESTMVYVSPEKYPLFRDFIWGQEGQIFVVEGTRVPGIQLINASALQMVVEGFDAA